MCVHVEWDAAGFQWMAISMETSVVKLYTISIKSYGSIFLEMYLQVRSSMRNSSPDGEDVYSELDGWDMML